MRPAPAHHQSNQVKYHIPYVTELFPKPSHHPAPPTLSTKSHIQHLECQAPRKGGPIRVGIGDLTADL